MKALAPKKFSVWGDERGFTIQEILVVLIVGSLLISFGLSLFLFANKLYANWKEKRALQEKVDQVLGQMIVDIQHSRDIPQLSDSGLVLEDKIGHSVAWRFLNGFALRNGISLCDDSLLTIRVALSNAEVGEEEQFSVLSHSSSQLSPLRSIKVTVEGSLRNYMYQTESTVGYPQSSKEFFHFPNVVTQ